MRSCWQRALVKTHLGWTRLRYLWNIPPLTATTQHGQMCSVPTCSFPARAPGADWCLTARDGFSESGGWQGEALDATAAAVFKRSHLSDAVNTGKLRFWINYQITDLHISVHAPAQKEMTFPPEEISLALSNIYAKAGKGDEVEWGERSIKRLFIHFAGGSAIQIRASV